MPGFCAVVLRFRYEGLVDALGISSSAMPLPPPTDSPAVSPRNGDNGAGDVENAADPSSPSSSPAPPSPPPSSPALAPAPLETLVGTTGGWRRSNQASVGVLFAGGDDNSDGTDFLSVLAKPGAGQGSVGAPSAVANAALFGGLSGGPIGGSALGFEDDDDARLFDFTDEKELF